MESNGGRRFGPQGWYLVSAGTGTEVSIGKIKLLNTERTGVVLVVIDDLVLLRASHGWREE